MTTLEEIVATERRAERPGVAGSPELPLAVPKSEEELALVLTHAREHGLRVLPTGLGSKGALVRASGGAELLVTTRELSGILDYEPGDGTVTARAGTTMADLGAAVAQGGHWLTPDVPRPDRATLGGVLAAGQSGADRLRFGPLRHHVLGMRVMLADGRTPRSGGKLVKNVTGYDLHRLYTGSFGGLCVILEASLRLFPAPEHRVSLAVEREDAAGALAAARLALVPGVAPLSVRAARAERGGPWSVRVDLAGRRPVVEHEERVLTAALGTCDVRHGEDATRAWIDLRDHAREPEPASRVFGPRSALAALLPELDAAEPGHLALHPGIASIELESESALDALPDPLPAGVTVRPRRSSRVAHAIESELRRALDPTGLFVDRTP